VVEDSRRLVVQEPGGCTIEVARWRITEAGRRALAKARR
jgi:hypothetical protein